MKEFFENNIIPFVKKNKKILIISGILLITVIIFWNLFGPKQSAVKYQTASVVKDTLVVSVSESGSVASSNRQPVTTSASGIVSEVDLKNGDAVTAGQTIAKISLDASSQQKQSQAWANYLAAQNALSSAQADMNTLQATLFKTNQAFVNDRGVSNPTDQQKADPVYIEEQDGWLAAERNYKNQQNVIAQDTTAVNSAWLSYQQISGIIAAPISGTISDLTIAPGMQIAPITSTTTVASQTIASVLTQGNPIVNITLSEIDAVKVKQGQKATVILDALPNKTFTGKVLGINTSGIISSGVTTYPAAIALDDTNDLILPNMSATANIILNIKPDVLLIPINAVQIINGQTVVRLLQNNNPVEINVITGESSDTQTEILSGLKEGQQVITGTISSSSTAGASSPFGASVRGFGGGGFFRTNGAGR